MHLGAGVLIGFGLSGSSFNLILGAFGKLLPPEWRPLAFGAGTAAGSLGQFFFPPVANLLIEGIGWHQALVVFAVTVLVAMRSRSCSPGVATRRMPAARRRPRASRSAKP